MENEVTENEIKKNEIKVKQNIGMSVNIAVVNKAIKVIKNKVIE